MAFSFGFSGDDIDIDETEHNTGIPDVVVSQGTANPLPELVNASQHDMNEWVRLSPERKHKTSLSSRKSNRRPNKKTALNSSITNILQSARYQRDTHCHRAPRNNRHPHPIDGRGQRRPR